MSHGEVKSDHLRPVDTVLGGSWKSSSYEKVERGGGNVSAPEKAQPMVDHTTNISFPPSAPRPSQRVESSETEASHRTQTVTSDSIHTHTTSTLLGRGKARDAPHAALGAALVRQDD